MDFYRVTYDWRDDVTLVAVDIEDENFFRYVASTGLWHLDPALSNGFLFGDDGAQYSPIGEEAVDDVMGTLPKFDMRSRHHKLALTEFNEQIRLRPDEVRTSADLGLTMQQLSKRPTAAPGLVDLLLANVRRNRGRRLAVYGARSSAEATMRRRAAEALAKSAAASLSSEKVQIETSVFEGVRIIDAGKEWSEVYTVMVRLAPAHRTLKKNAAE